MVQNRKNRTAKNGNTGSKAVQKKCVATEDKTVNPQGRQDNKWTFTYNNYKIEEIEHFKDILKRYCEVFSFEKENPDKTPHLQGTVILHKYRRLTELNKIFWAHPKVHWDPTRNLIASIEYTQKDAICSNDIHSKGTNTDKQKFFKIFEFCMLLDYFEYDYELQCEKIIYENKYICDDLEDVSLIKNIEHWKLQEYLMHCTMSALLECTNINFSFDYMRFINYSREVNGLNTIDFKDK